MTGRGAWSTIGMPPNGTIYYELITPENVGFAGAKADADLSHRAVMFGAKALQTRINEMGYTPKLSTDGQIGPLTAAGIKWLQQTLKIVADGEAGPTTLKYALWPVIKAMPYIDVIRHAVGGICQHESGYDPGAVGFSTPDDLGLVQINGPANPTLTEAQRFDYHFAFKYCADRLSVAYNTYHVLDYAIASYASPLWAQQWAKSGVAPNEDILKYVNFVKNWTPPF